MSLNTTTLSGAIGASDTTIGVASATGISAPVFTTGSGYTFLQVEQEMMFVTSVSGTQVSVVRGQLGTQAVSHAKSTPVIAGGVSDFPNFTPAIGAFTILKPTRFDEVSAAVAAATALTPSGPIFHVTGHTASTSMKLPSNFVGGSITVIADDTWTWTSSTNPQGFAAAGAATTAGSAVTFFYDTNTLLWYPSRLA